MTSGSTVAVSLADRSYEITIRAGLLEKLGREMKRCGLKGKIGIVTDRHVAQHYLKKIVESAKRAGLEPVSIILAPGERSKTLQTVERILNVLARHRFERSSHLLALGGGVVGDLAGFAASIYQRGIPYIQVPTTLVAQVDSSVGGKTGVDHQLGKNLIGSFYEPRAVWIDPLTLRTLPRREWVAGLAEVIKYGIIADEAFFGYLERKMPALQKQIPQVVASVVKRLRICCRHSVLVLAPVLKALVKPANNLTSPGKPPPASIPVFSSADSSWDCVLVVTVGTNQSRNGRMLPSLMSYPSVTS